MKKRMKNLLLSRAALAIAIMAPTLSVAATEAGTVLVATQGVRAIGADGAVRDLARRSAVFAGDRLVTGSGARAQIKFTDGSIMGLKPNSEMRLDKYAYEPAGAQAMFMSLIKGGFRTVTGAIGKASRQDYKISTPVATIGIRGTHHEGDFNPERGLALGVWDGGIDACSSSGCLDLGLDADFRFGFIGLDGRGEGRETPPDGIGGDDDAGGEGSGDAEVSAGQEESADRDQGLVITNLDDFFDANSGHGAQPSFTGFAALGRMSGQGENPLGTAARLQISDAYVEFGPGGQESQTSVVTHWWLKSDAAGGYITPGFDSAGGYMPYEPVYVVNPEDSGAKVILGSWSGTPIDSTFGDISFNAFDSGIEPGTATNVGIPVAGVFAFGTWASSDVIGQLTGQVHFQLHSDDLRGGALLKVIDASGYPLMPGMASGSLMFSVSSGDVRGSLDFSESSTGDWHLALGGNYSQRQLNLTIIDGVESSGVYSGGSYFRSLQGSTLIASGSIDSAFVGGQSVFGIVGAFDVATIDSEDANASSGVFFMSRYVPPQVPTYTGFAALHGPASTYPWGSEALLMLDDANLVFADDGNGGQEIIYGSMYSSTAGDKYILPGCLLCQEGEDASFSPIEPDYMHLPSNPAVRVAWGGWLGNDVSLSDVDNEVWTSDAISDPGVFIFGDWASPAVIAQMTGQVDFGLLTPFPLFVDVSGVPQDVQFDPTGIRFAGGGMTIDVNSGLVNGDFYFNTALLDEWNIEFTGTLAQQQLSLAVTTNLADAASASYFLPAGSTTHAAVEGDVQASFVGLTSVAGVVGSFDVNVVGDSANYVRGVFAMDQVIQQQLP